MTLTEVRERLLTVLTSADAAYGLYDTSEPAGELVLPAAEPVASGAYLTSIGPQWYLMITDTDHAGVDLSADVAELVAGDVIHLIGADGAITLTINGASAHNPGVGFPYHAVPVSSDVVTTRAGVSGSLLRVQLLGELPLPYPVHEHVPEDPAPPCVVLQPAENFVSEDLGEATYAGELLVTYDMLLLVLLDEEHDNADAGDTLDLLLGLVLDKIRGTEDWWLTGIGQPQAMYTSDWLHHGVRVTVQTRVTL